MEEGILHSILKGNSDIKTWWRQEEKYLSISPFLWLAGIFDSFTILIYAYPLLGMKFRRVCQRLCVFLSKCFIDETLDADKKEEQTGKEIDYQL